MNKYLLLRDNKQSGPYTVPEIIAKGIKPYDLVWLEGKSAAWRYPSEIEELKAYAPAVEEQPYDRFYKKPEPVSDNNFQPPVAKPVFEPVTTGEPVKKKQEISKKVYINFPGGQQKVAAFQEANKEIQSVAAIAPAVNKEPEPVRISQAPSFVNSAQYPDRKLLYAVIGACFILIVIISILIINSGSQKSSIKQLSDMVQQMEKRQREQNQAARSALASRTVVTPAIPQNIPAVIPENTVSAPVKKTVAVKSSKAQQTSDAAISFTPAPALSEPHKSVDIPSRDVVSVKKDEPAKETLYSLVTVKSNKYKTGLLGGISNLQFVLINNSSQELQRVSIEIKYFGPEKKLIKTQTVFFDKVAPGAQPILDVPKSKRGVSVSYAITDIKS